MFCDRIWLKNLIIYIVDVYYSEKMMKIEALKHQICQYQFGTKK